MLSCPHAPVTLGFPRAPSLSHSYSVHTHFFANDAQLFCPVINYHKDLDCLLFYKLQWNLKISIFDGSLFTNIAVRRSVLCTWARHSRSEAEGQTVKVWLNSINIKHLDRISFQASHQVCIQQQLFIVSVPCGSCGILGYIISSFLASSEDVTYQRCINSRLRGSRFPCSSPWSSVTDMRHKTSALFNPNKLLACQSQTSRSISKI